MALDIKIIRYLKKQRKELQEIIKDFEEQGIENLNYEETENYGAYLGKVEFIDDMLNRFSK